MNGYSVLVVSDSHGNVPALTAVLCWVQAAPCDDAPAIDTAVFLGDGVGDLKSASVQAGFTLPWYSVRGNCDVFISIPGSMVLEIPQNNPKPGAPSSRKLFLTHGNNYRVEDNKKALVFAARANGAEAALFGHTHVPCCTMQDDIFLLNPGSISRPRSRVGPTFAVLECPLSGPLSARFFRLEPQGKNLSIQELDI